MNRRGRPPHPDVLTPREWEVLAYLRKGLSNEQIAERLGITLRTAKFHVSEILSKLGVESREQAASWQPEEAPAPARRWLAWPLVARIAGALVVVAAVAGLGLLAWGVLRTVGDSEDSLRTNPESLVQEALDKMASLKSYRLHLTDSEVGGAVTVDVVGNDLVAVRAAELTSTVLGSVSVEETVFTSDGRYDRECPDYPVTCGRWTRSTLPVPLAIGPTVVYPDWPLVALERSKDLRFLPQDTGEPSRLVVRGVFDPSEIDTVVLTRHLGAERAGEVIAAWRTRNNGPAAIGVWISTRDLTIDRIRIEIPDESANFGNAIEFYYSDLNEVTIPPPN